MIVCHSRRYVYVRVPKTGSSSVQRVLERACTTDDLVIRDKPPRTEISYTPVKGQSHAPLEHARRYMSPPDWGKYFKFCFVRNPWDQVVSLFWWAAKDWCHPPAPPFSRIRSDFEEWLEEKTFTVIDWSLYADRDGSLGMNYVGRYENLQEDFDAVCRTIGLPCQPLPKLLAHVRKDPSHYSRYYTKRTKSLVAERFSREIEAFGYSFERDDSHKRRRPRKTLVDTSHPVLLEGVRHAFRV